MSRIEKIISEGAEIELPIDTISDFHTVCDNLRCVLIDEESIAECMSDNDCSHNECKNRKCQVIEGGGDNECYFDFTCE